VFEKCKCGVKKNNKNREKALYKAMEKIFFPRQAL
jgi:hypothetical protein